MKLIIIQKSVLNADYLSMLEDIRDSGADLAAFGELAVTGCNYNGLDNISFPTINMLAEQFRKFPFAVMIGCPRFENNAYFNSYIYFNDSTFRIYDKINLFEPMNETIHYQAGKTPMVFDTGAEKIGVSICYDIRFPELYDQLTAKGADMIFIPAAFPRVRISAWRAMLKERAIQTGLPVIGINAVGDDGTNEFGGSSMVIGPDGHIIAQADEIHETIIEVEL